MRIKNTPFTGDEGFHPPAVVTERGTGTNSDTAQVVGSEALPVLIQPDKDKSKDQNLDAINVVIHYNFCL